MSKEIWKDVEGYEGLYQVSNRGRVMRVAGGMGATPGRILRPGKTTAGYLQVSLCRDRRRKRISVHRLVAIAFLGPAPKGCEVNHKNGDKADNRAENLEWVTRSENHAHAYRVLGNQCPCREGEANGHAKLTDRKVRRIRKLYDTGKHTQAELGEMFGVAENTISQVVNRKTWRHVR